MFKFAIAGLLTIFAIQANSSLITVDADDFVAGDLMTGTFDYFDIRVLGGGVVYSAPLIGDEQARPENFADSRPICERVLSTSPDSNKEWMFRTFGYQELGTLSELKYLMLGTEEDNYRQARVLMLEFFRPVNHLSTLTLQLFVDAGGNSDSTP